MFTGGLEVVREVEAGNKGVIRLRGTKGRGTYAVCRKIAALLWILGSASLAQVLVRGAQYRAKTDRR